MNAGPDNAEPDMPEPDVLEFAEDIDTLIGDAYFDEALRRRTQIRGALDRRDRRRDILLARIHAEAATVTDWHARCTQPLHGQLTNIDIAIQERLLSYRAATSRSAVATPFGKASIRTSLHWAWPTRKANVDQLVDVLAGIDEATFVRETIVRAPVADNVKSAATVLDDGQVVIDGEPLPGVTATERTSLTVSVDTPDGI